MTLGINLLTAIVVHRDKSIFKNLSPDLFTSNELPHYIVVRDYFRQYGGFPTLDDLRAHGFVPSEGELSATAYYYDRCKQRYIFNSAKDVLESLKEKVRTRDTDGITALLNSAPSLIATADNAQDIRTLKELSLEIRERTSLSVTALTNDVISLPWPTLNTHIGGVMGGDIITFAGRPGQGKSYMMIASALHAWKTEGKKVLFLSMEMTPDAITRRMLAIEAGLDPKAMRIGDLCTYSVDMLDTAITAIEEMPDLYLMTGGFKKSVVALDAAIQEVDPDIVFVDASYLMEGGKPNKSRQSEWENAAEVGKELKMTAERRNKGIVQSVQLNRDADKFKKQRGLQNIANADVIGQISSVAIFINEGKDPFTTTRRNLTIEKNREGGIHKECEINFLFKPPNFTEITAEDQQAHEELLNQAWTI